MAEFISEADVKRMVVPDLRAALRVRGLTPAGGIEALRLRLTEYLQAVSAGAIPSAAPTGPSTSLSGMGGAQPDYGHTSNNYSRPEGQNIGNYITDRASSRVLAPPGGHSSISFGGSDVPTKHTHFAAPEAPGYAQSSEYAPPPYQGGGARDNNNAAAAASAAAGRNGSGNIFGAPDQPGMGHTNSARTPTGMGGLGGGIPPDFGHTSNNYSRPEGQNLGNYITNRSSSRVLAPPGGHSSISFGGK